MKIIVTYDRPPIPTREMDYSALDDDTYGGEVSDPIGRGRTREAAMRELAELVACGGDEPTPETLATEEIDAQRRGDEDTLTFIRFVRECLDGPTK